METIILILGVIVGVLFVKAWHSTRQNQQFEDRLRSLEQRLAQLSPGKDRKEEAAQKVEPTVLESAPGPFPGTPAEQPAVRTGPPPLPAAMQARERAEVAAPEAIAAPEQPEVLPARQPVTAGQVPGRGGFNWELFMGAKLFAWLGGLALFLAVGFLVKYSIERELISPAMRVGIGFVTGAVLVVGGEWLSRRRYPVTAQTLSATGVVILYAVTFASRVVYHFGFFGPGQTFVLMLLITGLAIGQAVRLNGQVVAVLGLAGGFLTPVLLSTGQDQPVALFSYVALLDAGMMAVAWRRRWDYLTLLAALGTVAMELSWVAQFFHETKVGTALGIFAGLDLLFVGAAALLARQQRLGGWMRAAVILPGVVTMLFSWVVMAQSGMGDQPGWVFAFVLAGDMTLLALVWMVGRLDGVEGAAAGLAFATVAIWMALFLEPSRLGWGLGLSLGFAALHTVWPWLMQRWRPGAGTAWWTQLFPVAGLLILMVPVLALEVPSLWIWPVVLVLDLLALAVAWITASLLCWVGAVLLSVLLAAAWMIQGPPAPERLTETLCLIAGLGILFVAASLVVGGRPRRAEERKAAWDQGPAWLLVPPDVQRQVSAFSALLPFLLLLLVNGRLALSDPAPLFAVGLILAVLLLGLACWLRLSWLPLVLLGSVGILEGAWFVRHFHGPSSAALPPLLWFAGFYLLFGLYPFVLLRRALEERAAWAAAALSGPVHFVLVYALILAAWPNEVMGLVPAAFLAPTLVGFQQVNRLAGAGHPARLYHLAWFGGVTLLFVTLIFPVQWEREWLTLSWALEGVALLWLFHRVPHEGLKGVGTALLWVAFVRLTLNPAVLSYHPRGDWPVLNWYLYAYGVTTLCFFVGARLSAPPRHWLGAWDLRPWLLSGGTILAFLLVNIEIADFFTEPGARTLTFEFTGNLGRDMTYSIAWALFALVLLVVGLRRRLAAVRYAGLALLGVALLKVFLHDLANLSRLYRVGALVGVAAVAILASFLYQKLLSSEHQDNR